MMGTIRRNQNSVKTYLALITIIAVFCLAYPSTAEAAVEVDAESSNSTFGTSSITISHTTSGTNRLMLVGVSLNNDGYEEVTGVTYNSVALTLVGTVANDDDSRVEIWRFIAPDTGTHDVVVTFSAILLQEGFAGVVTFTGVHQTTPLGNFTSAIGDGITATVDISSVTGELVFEVLAAEYSTSATVGAGQTERWNIYRTSSIGAGSTEPGAATVTMSWTLTGSGDHWAIYGVSIKPAAAGASDLDQIHYRWRNDNGGEEDGDTTQVSATADTTTTSTSDVLIDSMTITPGAGDYHIWFSGSVECNATSYQYVSLYVNGVQEAHTERQIRTEGSIPDNPFVVATHARVTGVTAGQAIEVRWRTTAGTATIHERTLAVTKITAADSSQASATADTTTISTTYTSLDSMSITPGAGDYMVWFSGSVECSATSNQYVSLHVNGVQEAHTERQINTEGSIANTSFPVAIHAMLTSVGASEAIEVRWRTTAGTATTHERTLVVYKINASDFTQVSATADATTTSATDVLILGMTITPGAGDYLVWFSSSLECDQANNLNSQFVSIYVNGTQVAHTERELLQEESLGGTEFNVMTHACIENVGAAEAIEMRWRRANAGTVTMFERTLVVQSTSIGSGATWAANQDTSLTNLAKNTTRRLRLEVSNEGTADSGNIAYRLEVSEPNPASPSTASYTRVDSSTHWNMTASTYFTDGDLTSNISSGLFDENTTFVDGQLKESTDETTTIALSTTQFTEIEYALQATDNAIDGATYYFRLTNAGVDSDFTYTSYAQVSLAGIAATLTLANHAYGQVSDKFTATSPLTDVLYRFKLTRIGTVTVDNMRVNFTTSGGVANGDVSSGELWEDADNDGVVDDPGDTQIQGSVTPSSGVLTFTSNFSPGTGGTNYLVRATVSNLTGGDATTFSVGTADIDEVEGGVTESGSISNATHTQDSTTFTTNYRSIGTNTGILYNTGNASISSGTTTVTFGGGASLPEPTDVGAVGVGDELVIGSETFYILSHDNATQVTVQSAATSTHSNASYTITRAYNDIQTWETARDGNLVLNEYVEVGVCYKDGTFLMTGETRFDGSITDSTHYMHLTVAEGQRHNGTAGTGVVVDGQGGVGAHLFNIYDPYTRLEWLEITNIYDNLGQPITTDNPPDADGSLIANILLHDYSSNIRGINMYSSVTVRNCIVYDGDVGIRMYEDYITVTMDNNTVYNMSGDGFSIRQTATAIMRNNISVGCGGQDFDIDSGVTVDPSSGNNLYSTVDSSIHPGTNNQSPPASLDDLFISIISGSEDLHIESCGHNALDNGQNLSGSFTDDIDGETRSGTWDIGADEVVCDYSYRKPITIQSSQVSGSSDFTDFPALVSLSGDWLKTTTADPTNGHIENTNGYDIIFKDSTGTIQLRHEIERYDGSASGGTLVAWVRIPTLSYNADTVIYIYYGNPCVCSSQENITGVWDSDYVAVWHLKESSGTVYDSTSNDNDGSPQGTPSYVDAKIGKAYNTTNGYFSVPYSSSLDFVSGSMFIECWVKYDDFTGGQDPGIFVWATGDYDMFGMNDPTTPRFRINSTTLEAGSASAGTWYYYVGRYTGSNMYTYHNTNQLGGISKTGNTAFADGTNTIGYRSAYTSYIDGIIDELRISKIDRGVDYMTTTYNNQNSPATFYNEGSEKEAGDLYLAEHAAGQETDSFGGQSSATGAELFAFKLTNETGSQVTVSEVQFQLSSVTGIVQGDFANLEIYVDTDNGGTIEAGETTTVGGSGTVNAGVTTITFSTSINISASTAVNYILTGDVSNLVQNDTVTIGLGTSNVTLTSGSVGGSAPTNATHTSSAAACDYSSWRQITIDNTKVSGTSDLTNFPLLVSLSGDWLKTTTADTTNGRITNSNGYDIIFKDTSGTQLDHEIEDYDGTNGTLVTWVRIPTLSYNTDTVIYMYYGNSCISSSLENITGVWNINYKGVWHFKETPTVDSYAYDSTSNDNDGTFEASMTSADQVTGQVDGSLDFDGSDDEVLFSNAIIGGSAKWTITVWMKTASAAKQTIYSEGDLSTGNYLYIDKDPSSHVEFYLENNPEGWPLFSGTKNVEDDEFHHVAIVQRSQTDRELFVDGQSDGTNIQDSGTPTHDTASIGLLRTQGWTADPFNGIIDEVRISDTARSAGWIQTEFDNQNDPSTFYSVGSEGAGCSYSHRKQITIQNSQVSGTADHTNFPALVSLTDTALRHIDSGGHVTNSSGYDIVFKASDETTQLDHEIESYDSSAGTIVAWVRIPTLSYNTDTVIYMYYGNTCISTSQESITGVWNSNYKAVWHLDETPADQGTHADSTSNGNTGTWNDTNGLGNTSATGKIDGADDFDGTDDYIAIVANASLDLSTNFTVTAWFYKNTAGAEHLIYSSGTTDSQYWTIRSDPADKIEFNVDGTGNWQSDTAIGAGAWHHMAVVKDGDTGTNLSFYVDGLPDGSATVGSVPAPAGQIRAIGYRPEGSDFYWSGILDEVRVSDTPRSADWIKTEYGNQSAPSSFYNEGSEETAGTVTLGNHAAGQETDNFDDHASLTGVELFAFKLTNTTGSTVTVKKVQFPLSAVTGIAQGDFSNLAIYVDADNDGEIEAGETTTVGGVGEVNAGVTTITFSDDFTIAATTAVNYILVGDVSNLFENDTVTIDLNPTDVTINAGCVGGSAPTSVTHTSDAQCTFAYRRPITIQSSQVSGTANLTDFPVLISLTGSWLRTSTADPTNGHIESTNGYDIIFRCSGGKTQLDHEIEDYDGSASGGTLVAWVRIPTLDYNDDTVIYMYYGNPCITSSTENITGVWDSNYKAVWHLKEDPSGTPPQINDSTSNNNDGTTGGTMISGNQVAGKMNGSVDFDGADDYATMPTTGFSTSAGTVEAWINIDSFDAATCEYLFSHCQESPTSDRVYIQLWDNNTWGTGMGDTYDLVRGSTLGIDTWYHLVITWDGTNVRGYLNGSLDFGPTAYTGLNTVREIFVMAWNTPAQWADGTLDELRLSSTARSADWIKTSFNNQNDPATFYNIGNEESPAPTVVDLISFTATGLDENVLVEWETAQEVDNLGFNLYRSTELGGTYSKLNRRLIPGLLSSVSGQQYTYTDRDVTRSVLYYYMLEDVDLDGTRTMHGPVCVDWDGDGKPDDYIEDPDDDEETDDDTDDSDPEVSIPDTEFDELDPDLSDWTPSNIGGSASWVKMASFKAYEQDEGVALEWETSYEIDNLGFHIYRELDGKFYRITPDLVPGSVFSVGEGSELPAGQSYAYWDALSQQTGREFYWLDSIELNGGRASFGPIGPEISGKPITKGRQARFKSIADYQVFRAQARGKIKVLREELSTAPIREQRSRAIFYEVVPDNKPSEPRLPPSEEQWALSAQLGMKIYVKEDGWYRVGEPELVAAGLRPGIDPRYLQLYADGVEQSILVTGDEDGRFDPSDAVEFYGTALDTPFTDAHVYWLVVGSRPGRRLDTPFTDIRIGPDKGMRVPRGLRGRGGTLSFPYTVELKERTFYFAALKSGERDNFFGSVISTDPVNQLLTLPNRAPSSPRGAMLEVGLQGATDVYHQVRILLNYRDAYEVGFTGQLGGRIEIPISQGRLLEGDNVVTLTAQGGSMDVSLADYVRITYWRTYTADNDVLQFKATGGEWLSIGGFSSPGIRVADITDSVRMLNVRGKVKSEGSGYAITIKVPGGGERILLAFTEEKIKKPAGIAVNLASYWHELSQGADVIIIGHSDLLESVRLLKKLREQQGLSVVLVDVEDLYDEFNFGAKSPWAVKDFLSRAYDYWAPQPRYLILVGDTSYDPRNYLGYGEFDLMPTKFVDTEKLKTASDDWFVDFDDDELPEMAVGRLPAASAAEVTAVVTKIINYEGYAGLMNEVLFVSDTNDFFDFEQASAKVAELIPENMTVNEIFRGRCATARTDLLDLLNQGQLLVNYFGHGSTKIWNGSLLTCACVCSLTNSPNLPFFINTTCLNGFFQDPYSESLAEVLLKRECGGAVAVWTSSGLTDPEEQVPLNEELIKLLFNGEGLTIGEAVMRAKRAVTDSDIRRTWILFGDPTLKLRK